MLKVSETGSNSVSFIYKSIESLPFFVDKPFYRDDKVAFTTLSVSSELDDTLSTKEYQESVKDLRELSKLTGILILADPKEYGCYDFTLWVPVGKLIKFLGSESASGLLSNLCDEVGD